MGPGSMSAIYIGVSREFNFNAKRLIRYDTPVFVVKPILPNGQNSSLKHLVRALKN